MPARRDPRCWHHHCCLDKWGIRLRSAAKPNAAPCWSSGTPRRGRPSASVRST